MVRVLEEVFSVWSAPWAVLGKGPIDTHSDNRRGVSYVVRAMHCDTSYVFSMRSDPGLYNESMFVARGITELESGVQKRQEKRNTTVYKGARQNES
jgi:hypothetical protein